GIADHPDLTIAGGQNTVVGEAPSDYGDNGEGHGTHVAGIIAAHGTPPKGVRGVAPVSFPASDPLSIAVSALGRKGTYPADAVEGGDVMAPFATSDPDYYITSFSNVGPEIALTGPGRSEERRVGKECRCRWATDHVNNKRTETIQRQC